MKNDKAITRDTVKKAFTLNPTHNKEFADVYKKIYKEYKHQQTLVYFS